MNKLIYLLLIVVCWACSNKPETEKYQYNRDNVIKVMDKIKEIKFDSLTFSKYCKLYIIDQYLLIADHNTYDHLINIFDKNTFQYITSTAYPGFAPDEIGNMGPIGIDQVRRRFDVTDYEKEIIFSYNLDSVLTNPSYIPEKKIKIDRNKVLEQYQYIGDSTCIGAITEHIIYNNFKMYPGKLNTKNGELTPMPYVHPLIKNKQIAFDVSPELDLYVECYQGQNLMTICSLDGTLKYNIYRGKYWMENQEGELKYYQQVAFGNDKIFALLLKNNASVIDPILGSIENLATKILVFDLNGDYIATLETRHHIRYFCYDKENNRILLNINDNMQFGYIDLDGLVVVPNKKDS